MTKDQQEDSHNKAPERTRLPKGRVIVYGKWCKECGICVAFCPRDVLGTASDGSIVVVKPEECTACRWCELHCPDFAIVVKKLDTESD
ncbi:MAG: 4Fe-4S dicluster domain-containing protein [Chloroflexota bacterium]